MEMKNLIQLNANVVRITNLKKGDVFKRIDDSGYRSPEVKYGVVLDLLNSGEKSFVEVLEYTKSYSDIKGEIKLFSGDKDINIFPCLIDEVKDYLEDAIKNIDDSIEKKKKELQESIEANKKAKEFVSGQLSESLTMLEFKEQTIGEYKEEKRIKQEKLKELGEDI